MNLTFSRRILRFPFFERGKRKGRSRTPRSASFWKWPSDRTMNGAFRDPGAEQSVLISINGWIGVKAQ
jgi:hypothetical protein